ATDAVVVPALPLLISLFLLRFFFTAPPTTEIYTLSLHGALPISQLPLQHDRGRVVGEEAELLYRRPEQGDDRRAHAGGHVHDARSEEHTSELQSRGHLVCRLLLEKKKNSSTSARYRGPMAL